MMLCVTTVVGAWGQAVQPSKSAYRFNAASDGTLYTDDQGTEATYAAGDVCTGTYYQKVLYQHTDAPATKNGPSTFVVKDYYVDGVCTFGQVYDAGNSHQTVATITEITDANKNEYITSDLLWTSGAVNGGVHKTDLSGEYPADSGEPVVEGETCELDGHYWVNGGDNLGSAVKDYQDWGNGGIYYAIETTTFKPTVKDNIYTLADGIYTKSTTYDPATTYYVVTFADADPSAVAAETNFEAAKLVDLTDDTRTLFHKNGTSYVAVNDGDLFVEDDAYYVEGESYQPLTPADLVALGYATATTTYYDCDVTSTADQITITYHAYGNNNFLDYFTDCADELSNHANVVVKSNEGIHSNVANVTKICEGIKLCTGVVNLVLSDVENTYDTKYDYDLSALSGSSVKRVILPNAIKTKFSDITNATPGVVLEMVNKSQWEDFKKVIIYSPAAGSLAAIKDYHYYSDDINAATRQEYFGEIGASDVYWFNGVNVSELDLSAITHDHDDAEDEELTQIKLALHELANSNIQYVVFPDLEVKPEDPLYTDFLTNCPNVIAVGQYTSTDNTFNAYSKQAGKISLLTEMLSDLTYDNVAGKNNGLIKNAKISGSLNAADLNGGTNVVDAEGHYTTSGGTGVGALIGVQLVSLDLKNAEFYDYENEVEYYDDMSISAFGIFDKEAGYTQSVILPTSDKVTVIPAECLKGIRAIHDLCIPYNIKEIHTSALEFAGINHITCTDALGDVIDYGEGTYALPAQLKLIQTNAFNVTEPSNTHDIYVLARIAPKCETHSFSTKNTWGDGGFMGNNAHPISRANYKNGVNLITVLHFPTALPDSEKKKYTDITRKYSLADETGATDDDGNLWMWPHHGQLYRSYDQAIAGVLWDDWRPTSDPNFFWNETGTWDPSTNKDVKADARNLATTGIVNGGGANGWAEGKDASIPDSYDYDYVGWHEFVLTGSTNYNDTPDPEEEPKSYWNVTKFKKQDWYTICVPFNMTKDDLARVFGAKEHEAVYYTAKEIANAVPGDDAYGKTTADVKLPAVTATQYPDVITLAGVTRNVDTRHIQIHLSADLIDKKLMVDEADGLVEVYKDGNKIVPYYTTRTGGDDEVIIEANKPYFIRPCIPEAELKLANAGKRAVEYTPLAATETQKPYEKHHVIATNADQTKYLDWQDKNHDDVPEQPYTYYFVGTYLTQEMPLYSYYLGSKGGKSTIFRNVNGKSWGQFTSIIGGVASDKSSIAITGGALASGGKDVTNYRVAFTAEEDFTFEQKIEEGESSSKVASFSYSMVTEEDKIATGVMIPNTDGSISFIPDNSKVYSISGQYVGNSLEKLSRGVYVVNGKKYIVR